ncbi:peptidoglycan editing factor PgeF [Silvimonas iriomotensis]|uniref:Purine nucleoside phosphorylase n=1 Tax=Silvimonas iriomotensis TaxID=449662 RepID=A0ABQ2PD96_9NEIS|nr:peptidoglycan editing factor PgeF [Silvimonas iriomotensis]GGP23212.1 laccase domain protein [Silvimonas iriomotensis]
MSETRTDPFFLMPDWPAPANVMALMTTRHGGVSSAPWDGFNLGTHVGDHPEAVAANRALLRQHLPAEPKWLNQVHGTAVSLTGHCDADASVARAADDVCVIMTADCLPVLFCDRAGTVVAAAHAGWRGLCNGVLEATLESMQCPAEEIMAWLGPAIGPDQFEVGAEVREAFMAHDPQAASAFKPGATDGKWLADIYALAGQRLAAAGIGSIHGGGLCTVSDSRNFFSYRRDKQTGRMAALIWLTS